MGDETTEGTRRRDDVVAPTLTAPVGGSRAAPRDAVEDVFDRPGGGADGAGTSDESGSPNQPGLSPSQKQQVHQDRLKEQTDSDTPSDRDESSAPEPGDPAQSPGTSSDGNWIGRALEEGFGKALDDADSDRTRTPESVAGGLGADTARSASTDHAQGDFGDLTQAGEDFAGVARAAGDPIGAGVDAISDGTVTDAAQDAMDTVTDTAGDALTDSADVAGDAFDAIGDATGDMTDVAGDAFDTGAGVAGDAFDAVADTTSDMVDTAADMLLE